jgi:hypothetical protein
MRILTLIIFVLIISGASFAQTSAGSQTGKLKGTVKDAAHAIMPNVTMVLDSGSVRRQIISDENGNYEIDLPLGTYTLTATKEGYRPPKTRRFRLRADVVTTLDIMFPPIHTNADPNPIRKRRSFRGVAQQIVGPERRGRVL